MNIHNMNLNYKTELIAELSKRKHDIKTDVLRKLSAISIPQDIWRRMLMMVWAWEPVDYDSHQSRVEDLVGAIHREDEIRQAWDFDR